MARTPYHKRNAPQENIFTEILRKGIEQGYIPERSKEAITWYRGEAKKAVVTDTNKLMASDPTRFRQTMTPGRFFMFFYDPKWKKELPYYDRFPMVLCIEAYSDSFLGLNLHYLPPNYRAKLMDALYTIKTNSLFNETTKIMATYKLLKSVSELRYFKPCIKKYLKSHIRSRFVAIPASQWSIAIFLPLQRFEKQPATKVWSDSVQAIQFGKPPSAMKTRKTTRRKKP